MLDICDDLWQSLCDQRFDLFFRLQDFLLKLAARIDLPDGARHSLHSSAYQLYSWKHLVTCTRCAIAINLPFLPDK